MSPNFIKLPMYAHLSKFILWLAGTEQWTGEVSVSKVMWYGRGDTVAKIRTYK